MGLIEITPPSEEPVSLDELKLAGHVDTTADDTHLEILRFAARRFYERWAGIRLVRTTFAWSEVSFLGAIASQQGLMGNNSRFSHTHPRFHSFGFHGTTEHHFRLIELPRPPLVSIATVQYFDVAGVQQTFANTEYDIDVTSKPGALFLNTDAEWPDVQFRERNGIVITFDAGFVDAAAVPEHHKFAIIDLALHWYENREAVVIDERVTVKEVPLSFKTVLNMAKVTRL